MLEVALLVILCSIGVIFTTPRQLNAVRKANVILPIQDSAAVLQGILVCAASAGSGMSLHRITGFEIFGSVHNGGRVFMATIIGFIIHLIIYYGVFRPLLPKNTMTVTEQIRLAMGLPSRLLQGGIVEEVQFRWGLMSLLAASGTFLVPIQNPVLILFAIGISALIFALFHLAGARQIGIGHNTTEIAFIMIDNTWGGIVFGWLFWKYGLVAAMASHALFHAAWFPIEKIILRKDDEYARRS